MTNSNEYRRQVLNDLAGGNVEQLPDNQVNASGPAQDYQSFDDFAGRSSREERRGLFGRSFHPEHIPSAQMEPELQQAISRIQPNQRDDVARDFLKHFKQHGLSDRHLEQQLGLSTRHANHMNADDVSKLAGFAYRAHPDIFQDVLADQPFLVKFMSNPLIGAALGAIAAKWFGGRH